MVYFKSGNIPIAVCMASMMVLACSLSAPASAGIITLSGPGVTQDAKISVYSDIERQTNYGGEPFMDNLYCGNPAHYAVARAGLFRFDFSSLGPVSSVNSATLRLYLSEATYGIGTAYVAQLAEGWVEGTGVGPYEGNADGVQGGTTKSQGTVSTPMYDSVNGLYYVDAVSNLTVDPIDSNTLFVRQAPTNQANRLAYAKYDTLADLMAAGAGRNLYYDDTADRLWLQDPADIRWYADSDMFSASNFAGGTVGNYIQASTMPVAEGGWIEFDVTAFVENWLIDGDGNYGMRFEPGTYSQYDIIASENEDQANRPQLIVDFVPEPVSMGLLVVGGWAMLLRRRS